jgi:hypothetical protein
LIVIGALCVLAEILTARVLFSQIGNVVVLFGGAEAAWLIARDSTDVSRIAVTSGMPFLNGHSQQTGPIREHDDVVWQPGCTVLGGGLADNDWRAARDRHFLEVAVGPESNPLSVRREEWPSRPSRSVEGLCSPWSTDRKYNCVLPSRCPTTASFEPSGESASVGPLRLTPGGRSTFMRSTAGVRRDAENSYTPTARLVGTAAGSKRSTEAGSPAR